MIYLLLYLFMGLALAVSGLVVWRDSLPLSHRLLFVAVLWVFWPLMVAAIIHERWALKRVSAKCAWCGEVIEDAYPVGNENWREHSLFCTKHPLRPEIDRLTEDLKQVEANRDALYEAIHGCGFELYDNEDGRIGLKRSDTIYLPLAATPRPEPAPYRGPQ